MTTVKAVPSNGQAKDGKDEVVVPDLAGIVATLDRVRFDAEHEVAREYLREAQNLVYEASPYRAERAGVSDALRRDWLSAAAEFAGRAAEFARTAAALLTPPPGEADDGQPFSTRG